MYSFNKLYKLIFITPIAAIVTLGIFPGCALISQNDIGIYIVEDKVNFSDAQTAGIYILKLKSPPIISNPDIVSYNQNTHQMLLTPAAIQRVRDLNIPVNGGQTFVVRVANARIYMGAFWTPISSSSCNGVVIVQPLTETEDSIKIQLGYPGDSFFSGSDPRSDPRILNALKNTGKLE